MNKKHICWYNFQPPSISWQASFITVPTWMKTLMDFIIKAKTTNNILSCEVHSSGYLSGDSKCFWITGMGGEEFEIRSWTESNKFKRADLCIIKRRLFRETRAGWLNCGAVQTMMEAQYILIDVWPEVWGHLRRWWQCCLSRRARGLYLGCITGSIFPQALGHQAVSSKCN